MTSEKDLKLDENVYLTRRRKILKQIKSEAALFVSTDLKNYTRDQFYPFQQNSDFYYLTGLTEPSSALLLLGASQGMRSILYLRDKNPLEERWDGERFGIKKAKRRFVVDDVRDISQLSGDLNQFLNNAKVLHYPAGVNKTFDRIVWDLFCNQVGPRYNYPNCIKDARLITSEMRCIKDRAEISAIRHAVDITAHGIYSLLKNLRFASSEKHCAAILESNFANLGAEGTAFNTIIASGKNSTILHHHPQNNPIWKKELLLVDAGARYRGYCGDITRTVPASGKFTSAQAEIYDLVYSSLQEGIKLSKPNSCLEDIHNIITKTICKGLIDLKILKGNLSDNLENTNYKKYYMHRSGHWLGLDVHDISAITLHGSAGNSVFIHPYFRPFTQGNIFTIEPGLYFDPKDSTVPKRYRGIGIRIEDDVLITANGHEILSKRIPTKRNEIEEMMISL